MANTINRIQRLLSCRRSKQRKHRHAGSRQHCARQLCRRPAGAWGHHHQSRGQGRDSLPCPGGHTGLLCGRDCHAQCGKRGPTLASHNQGSPSCLACHCALGVQLRLKQFGQAAQNVACSRVPYIIQRITAAMLVYVECEAM